MFVLPLIFTRSVVDLAREVILTELCWKSDSDYLTANCIVEALKSNGLLVEDFPLEENNDNEKEKKQ